MAVTFEFGKCAARGDNNSKTLQQCRSCGAALPWAKAGKAAAPTPFAASTAAPKPSAAPNLGPKIAPAKAKIGLGDIAYGAMALQLLGGFIFVAGVFLWCGNVFRFFPTFPFVGYITATVSAAMWRAGANMD